MASESNIGQVGVASIRILGQKIEELPFGARQRAEAQLPLVMDTERQNKIENILARFPKAKVEYLQSRVKEAQENILRLSGTKKQARDEIRRYRVLIQQNTGKISFKDVEPDIEAVAARDDLTLEEKMDQIHKLKENVEEYNTTGLLDQIKNFEESIDRFDETTQTENDSIAELRETIGLCQMRDEELKNLGVSKAAIG